MATFLEPTGTTPSPASDVSARTTPSFGSDDTDADARKATQSMYFNKPVTVAISTPEKKVSTEMTDSHEHEQTLAYQKFASDIDAIAGEFVRVSEATFETQATKGFSIPRWN